MLKTCSVCGAEFNALGNAKTCSVRCGMEKYKAATRAYARSEKRKAAQRTHERKYRRSEKGKAATRAYLRLEKYKEATRAYLRSEKGKAARRAAQRKYYVRRVLADQRAKLLAVKNQIGG